MTFSFSWRKKNPSTPTASAAAAAVISSNSNNDTLLLHRHPTPKNEANTTNSGNSISSGSTISSHNGALTSQQSKNGYYAEEAGNVSGSRFVCASSSLMSSTVPPSNKQKSSSGSVASSTNSALSSRLSLSRTKGSLVDTMSFSFGGPSFDDGDNIIQNARNNNHDLKTCTETIPEESSESLTIAVVDTIPSSIVNPAPNSKVNRKYSFFSPSQEESIDDNKNQSYRNDSILPTNPKNPPKPTFWSSMMASSSRMMVGGVEPTIPHTSTASIPNNAHPYYASQHHATRPDKHALPFDYSLDDSPPPYNNPRSLRSMHPPESNKKQEESYVDPNLPNIRIGKASNASAFVCFLKALFGVGLLAQPRILGEVGIFLGVISTVLITFFCVFGCYLLLQARQVAAGGKMEGIEESTANTAAYYGGGGTSTPYTNATNGGNALNGGGDGGGSRLITYSDLARNLIGDMMGDVVMWLIVVMHVLFASRMLSLSIENLSYAMGWEEEGDYNNRGGGHFRYLQEEDSQDNDDGDDSNYWWNEDFLTVGQRGLSALLFPLVFMLLQIPLLSDLFAISSAGLGIYLIGCVGTMSYQAFIISTSIDDSYDEGGPGGHHMDTPSDIWDFKWSGIPIFVATGVYAAEGINLALPTVNNMEDKTNATPIVMGAVVLYGILTLGVAVLGYVGGLGGGAGTRHEEDTCHDVSYCIDSENLRLVNQLSLSTALILTLPVILYPSTEMLEVWLNERKDQKLQKEGIGDRQHSSSCSLTMDGGGVGSNNIQSQELGTTRQVQSANLNYDNPHNTIHESNIHTSAAIPPETDIISSYPKQNKRNGKPNKYEQRTIIKRNKTLRIILAVILLLLSMVEANLADMFSFIRGIGLSLVGFILPPILYISAREGVDLGPNKLNSCQVIGLASLMGFGFFNIALVCISSFTDYEFVP